MLGGVYGTSEQFHSELKTDMNIERLPSGKFAVNAILLKLAMVSFNIMPERFFCVYGLKILDSIALCACIRAVAIFKNSKIFLLSRIAMSTGDKALERSATIKLYLLKRTDL